jgi:ribosomal protein S18 acetylase RimI-like enzyme
MLLTMPQQIEIVTFTDDLLGELIIMWRDSFEAAVGITDWHPIEAQKAFFLTQVLPQHEVRVALLGARVVGFVAASRESVSQLYVRRGFQRSGLGTRLLDWAKAQSGGSLWLYTFARNRAACAFYERSGFVGIGRGLEEHWQLEDVKYEWRASFTL